MTAATKLERSYTPEDLLCMPEGDIYEVVGGRLVEVNVGFESNVVSAAILNALLTFLQSNPLGIVAIGETGLQIFHDDPRKLRRADGVFVRWERIPDRRLPKGYLRFAPDLVLEVVSPNDVAEGVDTKVQEYLDAGVPLIWVAYPGTRSIHVFRADGTTARFGPNDTIDGGAVLPGFSAKVGDMIPEFVAAEPAPSTGEQPGT